MAKQFIEMIGHQAPQVRLRSTATENIAKGLALTSIIGLGLFAFIAWQANKRREEK